jgi:hypothetical protein
MFKHQKNKLLLKHKNCKIYIQKRKEKRIICSTPSFSSASWKKRNICANLFFVSTKEEEEKKRR